eukprot:15470272-Alexandrium_andersonii.AAC.1
MFASGAGPCCRCPLGSHQGRGVSRSLFELLGGGELMPKSLVYTTAFGQLGPAPETALGVNSRKA